MGRDKMVDTLPRPKVSTERIRELDMAAWQIMMMAHATCQHDMDEMLVLRDLCTDIMQRWLDNKRLVKHEVAARQGVPLLAEPDGNIIHLRPVAQE
jgi:hypothetical protein